MPQSLFTWFELQRARIILTLYPPTQNPPHTSGPRKPDMQEQELATMKAAIHGE